MSDIFNQQGLKSKFSSIIKGENQEGNDIRDVFNSFTDVMLEAVEDLEYTDLGDALLENSVKVFRPRPYDELINVPFTEAASPRMLDLYEEQLGSKDVSLPIGAEQILPTYKPGHEITPPLTTLANSLAFEYMKYIEGSSNPDFDAAIYRTIKELLEIQGNTRFSTGSLMGQVRRIAAGQDVAYGRNGHHKNKSFKELGLTPYKVMGWLDEYMPIREGEPDFKLTNTLDWLVYTPQEAELMGVPDSLPAISHSSAAGLPWLGKKKGEVAISALITANMLIQDTSRILKETLFSGSNDPLEAKKEGVAAETAKSKKRSAGQFSAEILKMITTEYSYTMMGLLFPKGERYHRADHLNKTRNIWSASYVTHLLGSIISDQPAKRMLNVITSSEPTPSLAKFSPTQGGMNTLVETILEATDIMELVYADNAYMYFPDEDVWYSIDLTKGEANCTRDVAMTTAMYLLTRGWTSNEGVPLYNYTWAYLALYMIPYTTVDSISILKNFQIKNPGQGSGNPWTFLNNHVLTTILMNKWRAMGRPKPTAQVIEKLSSETGIDFKVELVVPDFKKKLLEAKDRSLPVEDRVKPRTIVTMDMLGWDVTHTQYGFTPVLAKERLFKSIACPQPPSSTFSSSIAKQVHKYIQNVALLYVGGWAYPCIAQTIEGYALNHWNTIDSMLRNNPNYDLEKALVKAVDTSPFAEVMALINIRKPMHEQNYAAVLYTPKERPRVDPKRLRSNPFLIREGENVNQYTRRMAKIRQENDMVSEEWAPIKGLISRLFAREALGENIKLRENFSKGKIREIMSSIEQQLKERGLGLEVWYQAYATNTPPKGLSGNLAQLLVSLTPPRSQSLPREVFRKLLGYDPVGSGRTPDLTSDERYYYDLQSLEHNRIEYLRKLNEDDISIFANKYMVYSSTLLSTMLPDKVEWPEQRSMKVQDAKDPFMVKGFKARDMKPRFGAEILEEELLPAKKSSTEKRRMQRKGQKLKLQRQAADGKFVVQRLN
uniref:RNA-directed RNA polymerase n=1 Tax=Culicine-associated Z virus TaxID=1398940 RepID=U3PTM6_9VIRU|nr:VP1/RdRp [Culicine-associated Z virus]